MRNNVALVPALIVIHDVLVGRNARHSRQHCRVETKDLLDSSIEIWKILRLRVRRNSVLIRDRRPELGFDFLEIHGMRKKLEY